MKDENEQLIYPNWEDVAERYKDWVDELQTENAKLRIEIEDLKSKIEEKKKCP